MYLVIGRVYIIIKVKEGLILWILFPNVRNEFAGGGIKSFKVFSSRRKHVLRNKGGIRDGFNVKTRYKVRV